MEKFQFRTYIKAFCSCEKNNLLIVTEILNGSILRFKQRRFVNIMTNKSMDFHGDLNLIGFTPISHMCSILSFFY